MSFDLPSPFPPLYAAWMNELFAGPIPDEPRATCLNCTMCGSADEYLANPARFFHPSTKCCTYMPELPNYLVGRILADDDPAAAKESASIEARINAGIAVAPFGLLRPPRFAKAYDDLSDDAFGREPSLRCPHYLDQEGGLCGIWKNRNSVCSTWFCKLERGAVALNYWNAARDLLSAVEIDLARWCMLELNLDHAAPGPLDADMLNDLADPNTRRRIWGDWFGREREFYLECARLVSPLSWQDALAICGSETQSLAQLAQEAYRRMTSDKLPARLKQGAFTVAKCGPDSWGVKSKTYDREGLYLSQAALDVLPYFDGRPATEILDQVERERRLRLSSELLRRLTDFGILVAVDEESARAAI
ncbi:MAG: hypothetical protein AB7U82_01900 [Blastocatellales bacterium]